MKAASRSQWVTVRFSTRNSIPLSAASLPTGGGDQQISLGLTLR
ncbi:MAG: hypothetical protein ACLGIE_11460 [Alphaproteobacteria bacterium]